MLSTPAGKFRAVALAEAVTWLGLLTGMFFKYFTDAGEAGVKIFGPIHGVVFLIYLAVAWLTLPELDFSGRARAWALVAALPPFGTLIFERWAAKAGKFGSRRKPAIRES